MHQTANTCQASLSSDLPRAITSVKLLGLENVNTIDECFQKSPFPYLNWNRARLSFVTWAVIFRLMWIVGFSKNGESLRAAKTRAQLGTDKLIDLVIKALKNTNCAIKPHRGEQYWSYTLLELNL